jgi:hypothetical protein
MTFNQKAYSQVTIGVLKDPVNGALLDLKEYDPSLPDKSTSTKGLNLPRVALQDIDRLYPMLANNYSSSEDGLHTGLMVYNTVSGTIAGSRGSGATDVTPGIYVWNGTEWSKINSSTGDENRDDLLRRGLQ